MAPVMQGGRFAPRPETFAGHENALEIAQLSDDGPFENAIASWPRSYRENLVRALKRQAIEVGVVYSHVARRHDLSGSPYQCLAYTDWRPESAEQTVASIRDSLTEK